MPESENKKLVINGCTDCCFCSANDAGVGYTCELAYTLHIKNKKHTQEEYNKTQIHEKKGQYEPKTPDWCDLKKGSITISFKQ